MNTPALLSLLLLCGCSLPANARANPDSVFSEAGAALSAGEEEELLARLIHQQQHQEELQSQDDDRPTDTDTDRQQPLHLHMPPPLARDTEPELAANDRPPSAPIKKGQSEYVTFIEPAVVQSQRGRDVPEMAMKRSQEQPSSAAGGGVAGQVTQMGNVVFLSVVTVCSVATVIGMVVGGTMWHRLHKQHLAAQEAEYPQYGVSGPSKEKKNKRQNGDESMAYKAQLHHYQQTKQKIISGEESGVSGARHHESDESEGEGEDGEDYSVYECPGLAPTGDIEVQNPMFDNSAATKESLGRDGD